MLRVNKVDELQGPIGQPGVGQLVYRLAGFQYGETDRSNEEIGNFINELLENKNVSETVEIFGQLQTIAASALADGDWAHPVYSVIRKYFQTQRAGDIFILAKIKDRIAESLLKEEESPTMGVITTIGNKHKSLMFEESVFDEELNSKINDNFSFGPMGRVRISPISRDYLGIFDDRNRLISLVSSKNIDLEEIKNINDEDKLVGIDNYYESAQSLRSRKHLFNKILDLSFAGILEARKDDIVVATFAELLEIKKEELVDYLENEKLYGDIQKSEREVPDAIKQKSDKFFVVLKKAVNSQKYIDLEDSVYDLFNKKLEERKSKREKIDTLDLAEGDDLGFLGLNKDNLELFRVLQNPYFTNTIQETFGVRLADLDVRAQVSFLSFFSKATKADVEYFSNLISRFDAEDRKKICTAYLSFEEESEFGYIIEKLCERPEVVMLVISVVYELIGNAGKIEDFLLNEFKIGHERKTIASLYKKLINKAKEVLLKYNAKVMNLEDLEEIAYGAEMLAENTGFLEEGGDDTDNVSGIMTIYKNSERQLVEEARHELLNMNINQTLFLNAFKSLKEEGFLVSMEDIKGAELASCSPEEISQNDRTAMREIYAKNYVLMPQLQGALLESFDNVFLSTGQNHFYIFKHNGNISGFYRLEETSSKHYSFSAFNIDVTYRGHRLGEAMLVQSLDKETKGGVIEGDCDREAPISSFYIEYGFVGVKSFQFEEAPALHIVKNDLVTDKLFATKKLTREEIVASSTIGETIEKDGVFFVAYSASQIKSIPFSFLNDVNKDGSRYAMTRYFREKKDGGEIVYAVFEKISEDDFVRLTEPVVQEEKSEIQA